MKYCPECETYKPVEMFSKNSSRYDGLQGQCKECRSARRKADYIKNKDHENKLALKWRKDNPQSAKEIRARYYKNNKEKCIARSFKYRKDNPDWTKAVNKKAGKKWRDSNRDLCNARTARYRAKKLKATPPWLTNEQSADIQAMYTLAKRFETLCNIRYHVDHIVPLAGKDICGLHVPWNLQLLPASINLAKSNNY